MVKLRIFKRLTSYLQNAKNHYLVMVTEIPANKVFQRRMRIRIFYKNQYFTFFEFVIFRDLINVDK
jgi:hypothetical protein